MNKYTIISIIAIVIIIVPFAISGLNIYGAEKINYSWSQPEKFSYFTLSNHGAIEFCNEAPVNVFFKNFQIDIFYDQDFMGIFGLDSVSLNPNSSSINDGVFHSEQFNAAQHLFMQMDFQFNDGDIRIDPSLLVVFVRIDTPILGVIPYSTTHQYTGFDFNSKMKESIICKS